MKDVWRYDVESGEWAAVTKLQKKGSYDSWNVRLLNYDGESMAYLNADYNVSVYNTVSKVWYEVTIPYTLHLPRASAVAAMFITDLALYVRFPYRRLLCIYYRDGSERYLEKDMYLHDFDEFVIF